MTTTIVTRAGKGSALTWTEADANFTNLKATADGAETTANAALPKAGGSMSGEITFTDTGEGVTFSNGARHYDINASNIHAADFGATNTGYGWYKSSVLRGIMYAPATYSTYLGIGVTTNRTWSNTLQDTFGFATGPNGEASLVNNAGTITFLGHGFYVGSDYGYKYTTTGGVTPAMVKLSGGQVSFWTCASTGTAGNAVTFVNPLMIDAAGGSAGSVSLLSGQLKFPATQIASTDVNTLDDYEEGSWTPVDSSGAGLSLTSTNCRYQKIGKFVHIQVGSIVYPATANGLNATIGGLPFTSVTSGSYISGSRFGFSDVAVSPGVLVASNSTIMTLYNDAGAAIINSGLSSKTLYGLTLMYEAAA